jgi:hypothetical protein
MNVEIVAELVLKKIKEFYGLFMEIYGKNT